MAGQGQLRHYDREVQEIHFRNVTDAKGHRQHGASAGPRTGLRLRKGLGL